MPETRVPYKETNWRFDRLRLSIKARQEKSLLLELAGCIWRLGKSLWLHCKSKTERFVGIVISRDRSDLRRVYWVSPERIVYTTLFEFEFTGRRLSGNWDRLEKRFEDLDVHVAFREVCLERRKWRQTVYYERIVNEVKRGHALWGCMSQGDVDRRCEGLEVLFNSIKTKGYKSQDELVAGGQKANGTDDEIIVNIGRNGHLLFNDGAHRLSIAKLLGIPRVPVRIGVIHTDLTCSVHELLSGEMDEESQISRRSVSDDNDPSVMQDEAYPKNISAHR